MGIPALLYPAPPHPAPPHPPLLTETPCILSWCIQKRNYMACGIPRSLADAKQMVPNIAILRSTKAIKAENREFYALKTMKFLVHLPDI
jgi:hypothetical protein